ncbi:class I tRNA ligase family protein [Cytobacillus horneckiae]|uniref:class I tRNA ligase family protein n=1 Tax=Cytobacillus horneckiae TaxID=549687 RepID=UPI003D2183C2
MTKVYVTATPPTPNGDLHIGHLAGPYLAADVYSRFKKLQGHDVSYITYGDDNQSYVSTTANNKKLDPAEMVEINNNIIKSTLRSANIDVDLYKNPLGNNKHTNYVQTFFLELYKNGKLKKKTKDILFCDECNLYLYESFVKGLCPYCKSESSGNLCEACGQINDPTDLVHPKCNICKSVPAVTQYTGLFFPLNNYKEKLQEFYSSRTTWRAQLTEFCNYIVSKDIPDYPVTYPSSWGIPVPISEFQGQVINVWFEMYPGILESIESEDIYNDEHHNKNSNSLVQFLGFDNSFFNSVLHIASAFAIGRDDLLPEHIITNYFYLLDKQKFSTSKDHAVWGRDILKDIPSDNLRFYLSLTNPEHMQTNFSLKDFFDKNTQMVNKWEGLISRYVDMVNKEFNGSIPKDKLVQYQASCLIMRTKNNLERYYDLNQFSLRKAAFELNDYIDSLTNYWEEKVLPMQKKDDDLYKQYLSDFSYLLTALAFFSFPIMPTFSKKLIRNLGAKDVDLSWDNILKVDTCPEIGNENQFFFPVQSRRYQ